MDVNVRLFKSGIHNLLPAEKIELDAAQESLNFITRDGKVSLVGGRQALGTEGAVGSITGLHAGYKVDGTKVYYRKNATKIQYWTGSTWSDVITGLTAANEMTFSNYSSLAGSFTFITGRDGLYKIVNANPDSYSDVYNSTNNFKAYTIIDRGRSILWNRETDRTGLYLSYIDRQDSNVYTTVAGEAVGALGSTTYTGTLAFKGGGSRRTCFAVSIAGTVAAGTETFTDNYLGVLTSNRGGTGTINYTTGAYSVTFSDVTTGAVTAGYQWEDSSVKGVLDFSKSATRIAGEGAMFPQDEGGDAILNVQVGIDGAYYSLKEQSAYKLTLSDDDTTATNEVFRKDMGIPFWRACISTNAGIVFINTSNPTKPEMTILQQNKLSTSVEPRVLFPKFRFQDYEYDDASMITYDRWTLVFCKTIGSAVNNRILMCDVTNGTVDVSGYTGRVAMTDGEHLYVGDSNTYTVYEIFTQFDDLGLPIDAYWVGKDHLLETENLKKVKRLRFKGHIDPDQVVGVYISTDNSGFSKVGEIRGDADYVNYNDVQSIGSTMVGEAQIGGDDVTNTYSYFMEMKIRTSKFRTITLKLVPEEIGYFDFDTQTFWNVLEFENKIPKSYRQKQNVAVEGGATNQ